jgi:hypothetical protein
VLHLEHDERANDAKHDRQKGEHNQFVHQIPSLKRPRDDNQDPCVEMKAAAQLAKRKQQLVPTVCTRYNLVKHAAVVLSAYGAHVKASSQVANKALLAKYGIVASAWKLVALVSSCFVANDALHCETRSVFMAQGIVLGMEER